MNTTETLLHQILLYTKAQTIPAVRETAQQMINSPTRAAIYRALDGKTSQSEIARARGVKPQAVQPIVQSFIKAGLAAPASEFYEGPKALFTLDELGIDPSSLEKAKKGEQGEVPL